MARLVCLESRTMGESSETGAGMLDPDAEDDKLLYGGDQSTHSGMLKVGGG